jgi:ATP-dependent Clp protease adaptor protein ClpS
MNQFSSPLPHIEEIEVLLEELIDQEALDLVVFNDDVNTFEHVTQVLMKVCEHTHEQAEQCTLIIHYKGKCAVKKGTRPELKPLCEAILDEGIQAAIL